MAQTAKGPLESHSHIPPRNATLYGESPSYSATSGDPKPKTYCRVQARPTHYVGRLRQHGCEAATFFFKRVMRDEVCLDFQTEQGRAAGRTLLK